MTTAAPDTAPITVHTGTRTAATDPVQKRDPYVVTIPEMRTRSAKITWALGETLFLASVVVIGLCLMGMVLAASARDPQTAALGDFSLRFLPHGVGAFVASFALRSWRARLDKRDSCATQALEMAVAVFASVGVGFVVQTVTGYTIMLLALLIH